jgi:hypothetical protein
MNKKELLNLGFVDNSYTEEGHRYTEFLLTKENFSIEITGVETIEIKIQDNYWIEVPNCKTISDIKDLIRLFLK